MGKAEEKVSKYVSEWFAQIGYIFLDDAVPHTPSLLEQNFVKALRRVEQTEGYREKVSHYSEVAIISLVDFNKTIKQKGRRRDIPKLPDNISPYDFLLVVDGKMLLVEIDGPQHFHLPLTHYRRPTHDENVRRTTIDRYKTEFALEHGVSMLRIDFSNNRRQWDILVYTLNLLINHYTRPIYVYSNKKMYTHLWAEKDIFARSNESIFFEDDRDIDSLMEIISTGDFDYTGRPNSCPMILEKNSEMVREWRTDSPNLPRRIRKRFGV